MVRNTKASSSWFGGKPGLSNGGMIPNADTKTIQQEMNIDRILVKQVCNKVTTTYSTSFEF